MKSPAKCLLLLAVLAWLLAPAPAVAQVQMKIGDGLPIPVVMHGPDNLKAAAEAKRSLPNNKPTTFTAPVETPLSAQVWKLDKTGKNRVDECDSMAPSSDNELVIDLSDINCPGFILHSVDVEIQADGKVAEFKIPSKNSLDAGDNIGIALTLVDRWKETDADGNKVKHGSRANGGAGVYYSVSNLKNNHVSLIGNVSVLDSDPNIDFEVGLGFGLLFKFKRLGEDSGFGLATGIGYNLMLDQAAERWYTFVGFSMDFGQSGQ